MLLLLSHGSASAVFPGRQVYDNLYALLEAGLVRRIEPADAPALYEARVGDNHHHLVCRSCGRIDDIDCAVGHRPCLEPATTNGFEILEAEVTFWGICPRVRRKLNDRNRMGNRRVRRQLWKSKTKLRRTPH
jgi:hypothetical protein